MTKDGTLLIIDDTASIFAFFHAFLGEEYEILFARHGEEGQNIATNHQPDLILLDVMMPEINGFELCRRLKKNALTAHIPVMFISILDHEDDMIKGLEAGAIDYLPKPFHLPSIKWKIKNHLAYRALLLDKAKQVL